MGGNEKLDVKTFLCAIGDLPARDLFPEEWTDADVKKASAELFDRRFKSGFWAQIPRRCSRSCQYDKDGSCKLSKKPYGSPCPEERAFVELLMARYIEELEIEDTEMSALSAVRDLVNIEIQLMRGAGILARQDAILEEPILDRRGELTGFVKYYNHPAFLQQETLMKRKYAILRELLATRDAKAKAKAPEADARESVLVEAVKKALAPAQAEQQKADPFIDVE